MTEAIVDLADVLTISVGKSRKETNWKRVSTTWEKLVEKMRHPVVTSETVAEFAGMTRDQQQDIKDVGGFVGGTFTAASRKADMVEARQIIALDADYGDMSLWDNWDLMVGATALIHSTHKHTPENPRLRILAPLKRPVTADEYEPIARRLTEWLGIEAFDDTTYDVNRLMFWPSRSSDGEYVFDTLEGSWLDPDEILATYTDWHDMREWPVSSREEQVIKKLGKKQGNPLEKPGVIGAFNRAYTITEAIEKFLPGVYAPCGGNRWTFIGGTSSAGAVSYDGDTFLYSHHDHDPVHNRLCNAFDLVRLHLFGEQDRGVDSDLPDMPSMQAMKKLCAEDEKVRAELAQSIQKPEEIFAAGSSLEAFVSDTTEQGDAVALAGLYADRVRFNRAFEWMVWDGQKWLIDAEPEVSMIVMQYADNLYGQARVAMMEASDKPAVAEAKRLMKQAERIRTARGRESLMKQLSRIDSVCSVRAEAYDADPWILNTPDGIVDLRTGQLTEHNPDALCTKITECGLESTREGVKLWQDFLAHITCNDASFADYLQLVAGMAAVGKVYNEGLIISYGPGGNGKSTFFGAMAKVLGEYATNANAEVLVPSYGRADQSYVAMLRGTRLAIMGETEEGARMGSAQMKRLTSRDPITARALYKDPVTFIPTHTILMHTNHLPRLNSLDGGTRRRIAIAPFPATLAPEKVIADYESVLVSEAGGAILRWIVEGAVKFYVAGCKLTLPYTVRQATEDYIASEDTVQLFIDECCDVGQDYKEHASLLYTRFAAWARQNGYWERTQTMFGRTLAEKGFKDVRTSRGRDRVGLRLKTFED